MFVHGHIFTTPTKCRGVILAATLTVQEVYTCVLVKAGVAGRGLLTSSPRQSQLLPAHPGALGEDLESPRIGGRRARRPPAGIGPSVARVVQAHVGLEGGLGREALLARVAAKGPEAGVPPLVPAQAGLPLEALLAEAAHEGSVVRVELLVHRHVLLAREGLGTDAARKRLAARVQFLVPGQVRPVPEALVAHSTREARVHPLLVASKLLLAVEACGAVATRVGLCSDVRSDV